MCQISVRQSTLLYIPNTGEEIQCFALNTDREIQCPYFKKEKQRDLYLIPAKKRSVFVVVVFVFVLLFVLMNTGRETEYALHRIWKLIRSVLCIESWKRKSVCFAWIILKENQCLVQILASSVFLTE